MTVRGESLPQVRGGRRERERSALGRGSCRIRKSLHERLEKPDLQNRCAWPRARRLSRSGYRSLGSTRSFRVSRMRRTRHARQTHLREQPIDFGLRCEVRLDVQQLRVVDAIAAADSERAAEAPCERRARASPVEVETRSHRLLDAGADRGIGIGAENAPFAVGDAREILVESISAVIAERRPGSTRGVSLTPFGRKLTRVKRLIDRSFPNRLRRLIWKNPRGAT